MAISLDAIYFISASSCGSSTLLPCITSCAKQARIIVRSQADSTEDLAVVLQVSCWPRGAKAPILWHKTADCSLALLRVQWPGPTVRMPESKSLSSISGWWCRVAVGTDSRQNQVKLEQQFQCQFLRAMSEALRAHRFGHSLNSDHLLKAPAVAIDQLDQRYEPIHSIRMACGDCGFTR